jgi:HlyD family secretion protein
MTVDADTKNEVRPTAALTTATWIGVVGFILAGTLLLQAFAAVRARNKAPKTEKPKPVLTVTTAKAGFTSIPEVIVGTGSVNAVEPMAVGSEVSGLRVEQLLVDEGDWVVRGQLLAVLNQSLLRAQLSQAQARYRSGQAQVARAVQPNRSQDIAGLQAALAQAQASETLERANLEQARTTFENAKVTAGRYEKVLEEGFVTLQESGDRGTEARRTQMLVVAAERRLDAAKFAVEQARQRLLLAQAGGRSEDVAIASAQRDEVGGLIEQIEAQLAQTEIRAPENALVLKRDVHLGEISSSSKMMFSLARRGEMELKAEVPQDKLSRIRVGTQAQVSFGGQTAAGRVWQVAPQVESNTRLGYVRILVGPEVSPKDSEKGRPARTGLLLRPGMFAEARLEVGSHRALTIPAEAVQGEGGEYFVFRLDGTTAVRTNIEAGIRNDRQVEVLKGLEPEDSVVVTGTRFLADGDKVQVK